MPQQQTKVRQTKVPKAKQASPFTNIPERGRFKPRSFASRSLKDMTNDNFQLTRRILVAGIFSTPIVLQTFNGQAMPTPDTELVALGRRFEQLTQTWDGWAEQTHNTYDNVDIFGLIRTLDPIEAAIIARPAKTIEGLLVKARAANWSRGGRINPEQEVSTDKKMAWSIVRDILEISGDARKPLAQVFCDGTIDSLAVRRIGLRSRCDNPSGIQQTLKSLQPTNSRGADE